MYKNLIRIALFAGLIILTAANIFYFFQPQNPAAAPQKPQQSPVAAETAAQPAAAAANSAMADYIHGQVIYDARAALPPQAVLDIKLTAADPGGRQNTVIVAESKQQALNRSPLDWALPVSLSSLEAQKTYSLQAKINGGDILLFVNTAPMPVDRSRAAYIMRLEKLDSGGNSADKDSLTGKNWLAEILLGKAVIANTEVSLNIDSAAKADPAETSKHYSVSGSGGCNRYMGSAAIDEARKTVRFSPLATNFIVCAPDIAQQEADFTAAIDKVRRYKFDETGALYLLDEEERPLARFIPH